MTQAPQGIAAPPAPRGAAPGRRRGRAAGLACVAALLCACASTPEPILIALPAATRGSGLPALAAAPALPDAPAAGVLLVRRLSLPEYMVARRVRYTSGTARLAEWPDAYWAERIEIGMAREFVAALREALPGWRVCDASCGDVVPEAMLKVELQRLDVLRGEGRIIATAQRQLSLSKPGSTTPAALPAASQTFVQRLPADSAQGQAQALTDLLRSMAGDSAAAVVRARAAWP